MFKGTHEKKNSANWLRAVKKSIAAIKGKRRKNYQTVNERSFLNSLHKRHMCTLPLFVTANVPIHKIIIRDDGHPIHFTDVNVIADFSC